MDSLLSPSIQAHGLFSMSAQRLLLLIIWNICPPQPPSTCITWSMVKDTEGALDKSNRPAEWRARPRCKFDKRHRLLHLIWFMTPLSPASTNSLALVTLHCLGAGQETRGWHGGDCTITSMGSSWPRWRPGRQPHSSLVYFPESLACAELWVSGWIVCGWTFFRETRRKKGGESSELVSMTVALKQFESTVSDCDNELPARWKSQVWKKI